MMLKGMYLVMNISKDNARSLLLMVAIFLVSCTTNGQQKGASVSKGLVTSKAFKEYLSHYDDKESTIYSEKRFYTLIGEDAFLNCKPGEFYIVYLYRKQQDTTCYVYVLKFMGEYVVSSVKHFNSKFPFYRIKKGEKESKKRFDLASSTKIVNKDDILGLRKILDRYVGSNQNTMPPYDSPTRVGYYFNGKDYFPLTDYKLGIDGMNEVDNALRSSDLFK